MPFGTTRSRAPGCSRRRRAPATAALAAIARPVGVDDRDAVLRDHALERSREAPQAREVERHDVEPRRAREPGQQHVVATPHQHAVPAAGEMLAQIEDGLRGAGGAALMGELEDREGPAWHGAKVVILSRACTSWWRPTSSCRRRATAGPSAWWWRWCAGSRRWAIASRCSHLRARASPKRGA